MKKKFSRTELYILDFVTCGRLFLDPFAQENLKGNVTEDEQLTGEDMVDDLISMGSDKVEIEESQTEKSYD